MLNKGKEWHRKLLRRKKCNFCVEKKCNLRQDEDNWKVVLIEEEFTKRMFETE